MIVSLLFALQVAPLPLERADRLLEPSRLILKTLDVDLAFGFPEAPSGWRFSEKESLESGTWFVQARPGDYVDLRSQVRREGGATFDYLPNNGFEARIPAGALPSIRSRAAAVVPIHPWWKLDPEIGKSRTSAEDEDGRVLLAVEFWGDQDLDFCALALEALDGEVSSLVESGRYLRALVRIRPESLRALAGLPCVKWIQESVTAYPRNDRVRWIIQSNVQGQVPLWLRGITGSGVTIGHIDEEIFEGNCFFDDPTGALPGPNHRKIKFFNGGWGSSSHGTHTAGTAAGDPRPFGSYSGAGMAPDAFIAHDGVLPNSANLLAKLDQLHSHGARIHSNSWGNDFSRSYDNWCRDIDAYSHDQEEGLILFAVSNGYILKNPENAKSVVGVGATRADDPSVFGVGAAGPTLDGRLKPEVLAPGVDISSAAAGASCLTLAMTGTSMACPAVAGGAALLKEYFESGWYPSGWRNPSDGFTPSGSLLRACLSLSGQDVSPVGWPSWQEGWGRILLEEVAYFQGDTRRLRVFDARHAQGLADSETRVYRIALPAGSSTLKVALAWADEPASAFSADPVVNDLDLAVIDPSGGVYRGNIINLGLGVSVLNPSSRDPRNTLEMVIVDNPMAGRWRVIVRGTAVPVGPQGFALAGTF
ncbi:MAG TPA: hypothetical protein DDW23_04735 [Planctomycetes bacterium]|nr:hypothetical protein [Planctomycetota bacterium]